MIINKDTRLKYNLRSWCRYLIPYFIIKRILAKRLRMAIKASECGPDRDYINSRVDYYCKVNDKAKLPQSAPKLSEFTFKNRKVKTVYFFDTIEWTRYFSKDLQWLFVSGDAVCELNGELYTNSQLLPIVNGTEKQTFDYPTIIKSRPLYVPNQNSVLLKLNKMRHFIFVNDPIPFEKKQSIVIFRGAVTGKMRRQSFMEKYMGNPLFSILDTARNSANPKEWQGKEISIKEHLHYRYIMALEGNDVASNLKWVMSSNSIAVMPPPTCESWFMEGKLIPNYHYIAIKPDYSDIEERIAYYESHIDAAKAIIEHAHEFVNQFKDKKREDVISLLVAYKYFQLTN